MVDVFISYSRKNLDKVAVLARAIETEGYAVWWDAELPPHQSYGDVITDKIESAKAALVVWSEEAAASEWVRAEADAARNQKKLIQTGLGDIVPPLPFNQIQCANLGDWDGEDPDHAGWKKVKQSLAALCGEREKPAAPTEAAGAAAGGVAAAAGASKATKTGPSKTASTKPSKTPPSTPDPALAAAAASTRPAKSGSNGLLIGGVIGALALFGGGIALVGMNFGSDLGDDANDEFPAVTDAGTGGGDNTTTPSSGGDDGKPGEGGGAQTLVGGNGVGGNGVGNTNGNGTEVAPPPIAPPVEIAQPGAGTQPAQQGDVYNRDVSLVNQSGDTIFYFYWSNVDMENWGPDQLGTEVLQAGQSWNVTVDDGSGACFYDFRAITAGGYEMVRPNVNVCGVYEITFN